MYEMQEYGMEIYKLRNALDRVFPNRKELIEEHEDYNFIAVERKDDGRGRMWKRGDIERSALKTLIRQIVEDMT